MGDSNQTPLRPNQTKAKMIHYIRECREILELDYGLTKILVLHFAFGFKQRFVVFMLLWKRMNMGSFLWILDDYYHHKNTKSQLEMN
jgi:hypothetical protein